MLRQNFQRYALFSSILILIGLLLAACGDSTPTTKPTAAPTTTPAPPPPPAYLSIVDFKFADQAEKAHRELVTSRPNFPAYASWTESNHWYVLVRDSSADRLQERVGKDGRVFPVTYLAEGLNGRAGTAAYMLVLNRTAVDIKASGIKEAGQLLFGRAAKEGIQGGLLIFTLGNDQIYVLVASGYRPEQVMALASLGKVELVSAGAKSLPDATIVATSANPMLGDLKLKDATVYPTLAENSDFASFGTGGGVSNGLLRFELRPGSKVYEYSRANPGKYAALVFDRQVIASAQISGPIRDKGALQVPRWAGPSGQADMQRFVDLMNANPPQLFEAKELNKTPGLIYSGSFTR